MLPTGRYLMIFGTDLVITVLQSALERCSWQALADITPNKTGAPSIRPPKARKSTPDSKPIQLVSSGGAALTVLDYALRLLPIRRQFSRIGLQQEPLKPR
jgi:hypothetical protein